MNGLKLNLGCGTNFAVGWQNIDRSPNVVLDRFPRFKRILRAAGFLRDVHMASWPRDIIRLDVTKGLPHPTESADAIYSSHMLEHLYLGDARKLLKESYRVLRPGGVIRLALPDAEQIARQLVNSAEKGEPGAGHRFNEALNVHPLDKPGFKGRILLSLSGEFHRWQPTRDMVIDMLVAAGFSRPTIRDFQQGDLPDLHEVEHREGSLFIEAVK